MLLRTIEAGRAPEADHTAPVDLGRGLVAFRTSHPRSALTAVDLLAGEVRWEWSGGLRPLLTTTGRLVCFHDEIGDQVLVLLDPESGGELARAPLVQHRLLEATALALDDRTLAWVGEGSPGSPQRLELFDLVDLRAVRSVELPASGGRAPGLHRVGERLVAVAATEQIGLDAHGALLWRTTRLDPSASCLGEVNDQLLFESLDGVRLALDAATGEQRAVRWPWAEGAQISELWTCGPTVVLHDARRQRLFGVERSSLEPSWSSSAPHGATCRILATADTVLVLDRAGKGPQDPFRLLRALDARTGQPTGELELGRRGAVGIPVLVAGRLVLWVKGTRQGPTMLLVVEGR